MCQHSGKVLLAPLCEDMTGGWIALPLAAFQLDRGAGSCADSRAPPRPDTQLLEVLLGTLHTVLSKAPLSVFCLMCIGA